MLKMKAKVNYPFPIHHAIRTYKGKARLHTFSDPGTRHKTVHCGKKQSANKNTFFGMNGPKLHGLSSNLKFSSFAL